MSRDFMGVVSGLAVLAMGAVALVTLAQPADLTFAISSDPITTTLPTLGESVDAEPAPPELPGVAPEIANVLHWNGDTRLATGDEMNQLPPAVEAVLVEFGVPLLVPIAGDGR